MAEKSQRRAAVRGDVPASGWRTSWPIEAAIASMFMSLLLRSRCNSAIERPSSSVRWRSSLSSRVFSTAIAAWAAKLDNSSTCLSEKGRTSWRYRLNAPITSPSFRSGTTSTVRAPPIFNGRDEALIALHRIGFLRHDVGDLDRRFGRDHAAERKLWIETDARRASIKAAGVLCDATRCSVSPSSRNTLPYLASQMRAAWASILPKAGCRSPGEPLMICSTSAVAACCCEASSSSRVSRAISAFWRALAEPRRRAAAGRCGALALRTCAVASWFSRGL